MNAGLLVTILIIVGVVVLVAVRAGQRRRTRRRQRQFGPEYRRTVARAGDQHRAEADLSARRQRRRELDIVALQPAVRDRYLAAWRATQGRFVDDPAAATAEADTLVGQVLRERGYPVDDFEQRAADVSVDHPQVAEDYRAAHAIHQAHQQGLAGTDDLRQAFVHYRSLFAELLDVEGDDREEARR